MKDFIPDKALFKEDGRPRTQSLFLEVVYADSAVYTLKEHDHEWNGRVFPSLKRLYIEAEDPAEYDFANKYLLNWQHWIRIQENKLLVKHVAEWREELEMKLRSRAVKEMAKAAQAGNYQATKWFVDKGWETRPAGRPSKAEIAGEKAKLAKIGEEFSADVHRMFATDKR